MTDASKRGRSKGQNRDATPEYPIEGTVLLSGACLNKKPKRTPRKSCEATSNEIVIV